jgi:copper resistance protein D
MVDPIVYARAVHFAATIVAAGIVFFVVLIAEPAARKSPKGACFAATLRLRLASLAWISLGLSVLSGAAWLILTAASMSGQSVAAVFSQGVLGTVLSQTDFGNDWLARFVFACVLAATFVPLLSARGAQSVWLKATAIVFAAAFVGSLAFAGHAIGGEGIEGVVHPAADILHLIAAAAWVGALAPLALLFSIAATDADTLAVARSATLRFSTLGMVSVATLLLSGLVNGWYLVGSVTALTESDYGRLLSIKLVLFLLMVAVAAFNWSRLTPKLVQDADLAAAQKARRQLRRNTALEAALGAVVIIIVAELGILPPASHAHHHEIEEAVPADASFQHIHSEHGMADVVIEPGRVGTARVVIHLLDDNLETLPAKTVTLTLTAPTSGSKPITRRALLDPDGEWDVDGVGLAEPGNWTVAIDAVLASDARLKLAAPIVIDAK